MSIDIGRGGYRFGAHQSGPVRPDLFRSADRRLPYRAIASIAAYAGWARSAPCACLGFARRNVYVSKSMKILDFMRPQT
ncbi:hypothetical protein P3W85_04795 [Cupriavidus basilensis]|uniref:Uncharacterized protein n=1 Tax=Cupriavidus basilensis TaxID=68895 RepID=A0ABT6AI37_9BURK|nr:hypothetical protein [Cupriavidus basilensis]MDF3832270.1 hypothetical protein [Cupriavidus basilensis]